MARPIGVWNGPDDHAAAIAVAWTPAKLFLGVKVVDDVHQNPGVSRR
jgi:hypothetical protein